MANVGRNHLHDGAGANSAPTAHENFSVPVALSGALSILPLALGLVVTTIIIAGLYYGRPILVPLVLAFFLGFVLDPLVSKLKRLGMARPFAVVLVACFALTAIVGSGFVLAMQVRTLSAQLPVYQHNIKYKLRTFVHSFEGPSMFEGAITTFDTVKKEVDAETAKKSDSSTAPQFLPEPQRVQIQEAPVSPIAKAGKWLDAIGGPLTDAGIVLVFVVLVLLDRQNLRDRLLRLLGGNLHRTTDAMDDAGTRISKYLTMQLLVNLIYGVPMAIGLAVIGIPGAVLWGAVAAIMRFVPYIGPMISALFPLALAFAVDQGWTMLVWVFALIVFLELVSNNLIEPWAYGTSTGLSAMSLMVSATFWTLLWGPVGLVMSTPLTVCLLVIGRHLPQLRFFDVLLGSQPVLDTPTRVYQRLLADDPEDAIELATAVIETDGVAGFYGKVAIPALRIASADHDRAATAEHRLRVVNGMERLLAELRQQHPSPSASGSPQVVCLGAKWEVDMLAANMVTHALGGRGISAQLQVIDTATADFVARLDLVGARIVCLSHFSPDPSTRIRYLCRHLRRRWPDIHIVGALWNAPPNLLDENGSVAVGLDVVATSFEEVMLRVHHQLGAQHLDGYMPAPIPDHDLERVRALRASGAFDESLRRDFDLAARRAAEVFDTPIGMVTLIDETTQHVCGASLPEGDRGGEDSVSFDDLIVPRELSLCGHVIASANSLVIEDIARDPRFANNPTLSGKGVRFYAGAPFCNSDGHIFGSLCIIDLKPRTFTERDLRLLESMAKALPKLLQRGGQDTPVNAVSSRVGDAPTGTTGQLMPS